MCALCFCGSLVGFQFKFIGGVATLNLNSFLWVVGFQKGGAPLQHPINFHFDYS